MNGGLRERARRAVRAEAAQAAMELFLTQGFEATTVDQVAEVAGMSKSSFFRYFASKEDLVVDSFDLLFDDLVEALAARPLDEPAWDALGHSFGVMVISLERQRAATLFKVIHSSPTLSAAWLQRVDRVEQRLAEVLRERATQRGEQPEASDVVTRATVGAAWACLKATYLVAFASEGTTSVGALLEFVLAALRPCAGTVRPSNGARRRRH